MLDTLNSEIQTRVGALLSKLRTLQNDDGGFKAYYCHDSCSGVWTSAEILHIVSKMYTDADRGWLIRGRDYLIACQNPDGGWPFRKNGKSITDITAWCCLALSQFDCPQEVSRGVTFILNARTNEGSNSEEAWGLTAYESDRTYSTWIASYCLSRLLRTCFKDGSSPFVGEMEKAVEGARDWLLRSKNDDGSWGTRHGAPPQYTSTAVALLTLFLEGMNPIEFKRSCEFLRSGMRGGLWEPEIEIIVTSEGYELPQEWFTSALCFRALIFFSELGVVPIDELHDTYRKLIELIHTDGSVSISPNAPPDLAWSIPYMLEAMVKYRTFVSSKEREYRIFLEHKAREFVQHRKHQMDSRLQHEFPYPISHEFSAYQHELDFQRKFQLGLQLYEVAVKYSVVVALAGYLYEKEKDPTINGLLATNFRRPSFGDWCNLLQLLSKSSAGFGRLLHPLTGEDILRSRRDYLDESAEKSNLNQVLSAITSLRNTTTGHGALRTLYEYKLMVEKEEGRLYSFFDRIRFLASSNSFLVLASQYDEFGEGDRYKIRIFKGQDISDSDLETGLVPIFETNS